MSRQGRTFFGGQGFPGLEWRPYPQSPLVSYALSRYEEQIAIRQKMVAERKVWPINLEPDPDGRHALHLALQEESPARKEYMRVLRVFMKLILHGTLPEGDPDS